MKISRLLAPLALVLAPGLARFAPADTITTTAGNLITGVTIVDATATTVTYKPEGKKGEKSIGSDSVLSIEYSRMPKKIDQAESSLDEGLTGEGVQSLREYVREYVDEGKAEKRMKWAPAYAQYRLVQIYFGAGEIRNAVARAKKLIATAPDSFYAPPAHLAKSEAELILGLREEAAQTLRDFRIVVDKNDLSRRWRLECDLGLAILDPALDASKRMKRVVEIGAEAGTEYPTVRNRARVAEGEALIQDPDKTKNDYKAARTVFEKITSDPTADDRTLAAAYAGLGDCLFQQGAGKLQDDSAAAQPILQEALLHFLRAASYKGELLYRPRALYYAGRVFDFLEGEENPLRARRMYLALAEEYPESTWVGTPEVKKAVGR